MLLKSDHIYEMNMKGAKYYIVSDGQAALKAVEVDSFEYLLQL